MSSSVGTPVEEALRAQADGLREARRLADAAWVTRGPVSPAGIRLIAALAGGGAGLAVLVLSVVPGFMVIFFFYGSGGLVEPVAGLLVLGVLGAVCGLAAGYTSRSFSESAPVLVALGAWAVWALAITNGVVIHLMPPEFGWVTLPAGLVGALVGARARGRGAARRAPRKLVGTGLLGALGAFAVLTLGIAALSYAAQFEWFRFRGGVTLEDLPTVSAAYQRGWEAALWAVIILATAVSAALPVAAVGRPLRRPAAAAALGLVLFLALGGLSSVGFSMYLGCSGVGSLPPFVWLTGNISC